MILRAVQYDLPNHPRHMIVLRFLREYSQRENRAVPGTTRQAGV